MQWLKQPKGSLDGDKYEVEWHEIPQSIIIITTEHNRLGFGAMLKTGLVN